MEGDYIILLSSSSSSSLHQHNHAKKDPQEQAMLQKLGFVLQLHRLLLPQRQFPPLQKSIRILPHILGVGGSEVSLLHGRPEKQPLLLHPQPTVPLRLTSSGCTFTGVTTTTSKAFTLTSKCTTTPSALGVKWRSAMRLSLLARGTATHQWSIKTNSSSSEGSSTSTRTPTPSSATTLRKNCGRKKRSLTTRKV